MALYQITADPELATMKITKEKIRGGVLFDYVLSAEDERIVREKAVAFLKSGPHEEPPPPSVAEANKLMNLFGGRMIEENDVLPGYEELSFDTFPRGVEWAKAPPPKEKLADYKVLVVGAGLSGIAAAIQLKNLGIPYTVIDRQETLGGTWLWNTYPECRVDTLSYLFQYKFEKNYKWPEFFAARQDTLVYLKHVASKHDILKDFQFNKEVIASTWDESSSTWKVTLKSKLTGEEETVTANSVISATGLFSTPNLPDIPGITDFKGHIFHTTAWDHKVDYKDLRIAVIGTGSTGAQLIPNLGRVAKNLAIYQRTPNWIVTIEGYRAPVPSDLNWMFDHMPYYWNWYCYAAYFRSLDLAAVQVKDKEYEAKGGRVNERNDSVREALTNFITKKMASKPELIKKLVPTYPPLVRRLVMDNGFYDTLLQDNCELVTDSIERITEKGIKTKDGKEREFDLIVLAGGFKTSKYFFPTIYKGKGGITLEQLWKKDGARTYLGMVMPGFPNFFSLYGPNHQPRGGSLYSWAEIWARYAVASVKWMIENDKKSMDVKPEVNDKYQDSLDEASKKLIWEYSEGQSYYVNEFGRSGVNMPWTTSEYHAMVIKPNPDDFVTT
ncbi:FAD/NAD(P)-binding domain-containing protein [Mytilinidion resinicola]|uniref:FAD/NAD(P)-binding domain-containing protein n=1 Tax=Mytilinidion resinicola TaxID=574789 RepID=A0A6A6Y2U4_9PEZI|nr:FAD/NAD(P)-binding domain-containing protein [Mytilinidion resinicola]KAF2802334.1 FAD/NAD(P)-binding domain-containing protein [Mytilinidion resinicola]